MRLPALVAPFLATGVAARSVYSGQTPIDKHGLGPGDDVCPLPPKVAPPSDGFHSSLDFVRDPSIRQRQADRLSRAVQVPSTSTELEDDPWSDYYAPFIDLHKVLAELFPLVYVSYLMPNGI
jgi:Gly-Xaa carboxypeptidase